MLDSFDIFALGFLGIWTFFIVLTFFIGEFWLFAVSLRDCVFGVWAVLTVFKLVFCVFGQF